MGQGVPVLGEAVGGHTAASPWAAQRDQPVLALYGKPSSDKRVFWRSSAVKPATDTFLNQFKLYV